MTWYCNLMDKHNHMTTFVPSFDAAYLLLSSKLTLMEKDLLAMAEDSSLSIVVQLTHFYDDLSRFSQQKQQLNIDQVLKYSNTLAQYGKFQACLELCQYSAEMLKDADISTDKKKEIAEKISSRQLRAEFNIIAQKANIIAKSGDYVNASNLYIKAFDMKLIQATHLVRINAVPVFAQAGKIEEAFVQLDLLANKFKLGSNAQFINDPKCTPLHNDIRWNVVMDKLAQNGKLYQK